MSWKSIICSIFAVLLFIAVVFAIAFLFSLNILIGFASIVLTVIPALLQRKALRLSGGIIDKLIAKIIVPILFVVIGLLAILGIGFWLGLFFT